MPNPSLSKIKLNGIEYELKDTVARQGLDNIYIVNVTLTSLIEGTSDKTHTEILNAINAGKVPFVKASFNGFNMLASLTHINSNYAIFTYINQLDDDIGVKYAQMKITNNIVTLQILDSNFAPSTTIPTLTSELTNDSGFITSESDPFFTSSAAASISYEDINKWNSNLSITYVNSFNGETGDITYTAPVTSVNEETGNVIISKIKTTASSNNVEYNLMGTSNNNNTMAVSPYNQDLLSFAKTTNEGRLTIGSTVIPGKVRLYSSVNSASGYTDLKSNVSGTNTREISFPDATGTVALTTDIPNVPSWALAANKPSYTFSELTTHPTSLGEYGITDVYTKTEVDGLVSGVLHYKGTKTTVSVLPSTGNTTGDVWHVTADGSEWAWDGSDWQELGTAVDLSGYVPTSRTINGKALTSNISLTARDVRALPSNTTYVSSFNGSTGAITYTAPVTSVNGQTGAVTVTTTVTQTLTSGTAIGSVAGTTLYAPAAYDDTALAARVTALEQIPWVTYYTGSNTPSNSQGTNGDLYFQTSE